MGSRLAELLRRELCPRTVRDGSSIAMVSPWEERDYRLGIYLYDIQDYSAMIPYITREDGVPPKAVELYYMIFCGEAGNFGKSNQEEAHIMLNEVMRAVAFWPELHMEDGAVVHLHFVKETVNFKLELWGSFQKPLRPAVYLQAVPVLISSGKTQEKIPVKEARYQVMRRDSL